MYPDKPLTASGVISIQNTGAPTGNGVTANSTVKLDIGGSYSSAAIQVRGTYTGALTVQVTLDGDLWVTLSGSTLLTNMATGAQSATIASGSQGVWALNTAGLAGVRVTGLAAMTGSATVTIIGGVGDGVVISGAPLQLAAGSASIGTVVLGNGTGTVGYPAAGSALSVLTTASTNASAPKTSAGNLFELTISNPTATAAYVKFYNKASAPTVGTDTPVLTVAIPATAAGVGEKTINFGALGKRFTTGIAMAVTGAAASSDTSNAVAGVQIHGTYF